jgi:hypothetical protein
MAEPQGLTPIDDRLCAGTRGRAEKAIGRTQKDSRAELASRATTAWSAGCVTLECSACSTSIRSIDQSIRFIDARSASDLNSQVLYLFAVTASSGTKVPARSPEMLLASSLQAYSSMKHKSEKPTLYLVGAALAICLTLLSLPLTARTISFEQNSFKQTFDQQKDAQAATSAKDKQAISLFDGRVKEYLKLRNQIRDRLPKLSKDSTPEQIHAHMVAFQEAVRAARVGAKRGDLFTAEVAGYIRRTLRTEFKGKDRKDLRKTILEAETKGVPLRVNYPYPEAKELTEMPPTLLLKLPQLPKEVKYRFVGPNMLLVDRENNLIIDYTVDALP